MERCDGLTGKCVCDDTAGFIRSVDPNDNSESCIKPCDPPCDANREFCVNTVMGGLRSTECLCLPGFTAERASSGPVFNKLGGVCVKACANACDETSEVCEDGTCVCNSLAKYFANPSSGKCELLDSVALAQEEAQRERERLERERRMNEPCATVNCPDPLTELCEPRTKQCECRTR